MLTHRVAYLLDQGLAAKKYSPHNLHEQGGPRDEGQGGPPRRTRLEEDVGLDLPRLLRAYPQSSRREAGLQGGVHDLRRRRPGPSRQALHRGAWQDPKRFNPRSFQAQISSAKNVLMAPDDFLHVQKATSPRTSPKSTTSTEASTRTTPWTSRPDHADRRPPRTLPEYANATRPGSSTSTWTSTRIPTTPSTASSISWQQDIAYVSLVMTISQCTRGEEQIFEHSGLRAGLSRGQGRQAGAELPFDADYSRCGERGGSQ